MALKLLIDNYRVWWQKPRSVGEGEHSREVSFLELFYDLVYVVLISLLAHVFAQDVSWLGLGKFVFIFFFIFWAWANGMFYHELHGQNDVSTRVFTFVQMLIVGSMGLFIERAFSTGADGFAISLGAYIVFMSALWFRTGIFDKAHKVLSWRYSAVYFLTALAMLASVFFAEPLKFYIWLGVLLVSVLLPFLFSVLPVTREQSSIALGLSHSAIERYGLFTIIVLGEVVVSAIRGAAEFETLTTRVWLISLLGMLIAIGLWWLYFDFVSRRQVRDKSLLNQLYIYLHMPFLAAVAGGGAVVSYIVHHQQEFLSSLVRWVFVSLIAVALTMVAILLGIVKQRQIADHYIHLGMKIILLMAAGVLALGYLKLGIVATMSLVVVLLMFPVFVGTLV